VRKCAVIQLASGRVGAVQSVGAPRSGVAQLDTGLHGVDVLVRFLGTSRVGVYGMLDIVLHSTARTGRDCTYIECTRTCIRYQR
jgi:hypothetical protein